MLIKLRLFKLAALGGTGLLVLTLLSALFPTISIYASVKVDSPIVRAAKGLLRPAVLHNGAVSRRLPFFSSGILSATLQNRSGVTGNTVGCGNRNAFHDGSVRVNQDCTYRRQAEELIKVNPTNSQNLIAGQNDSRLGFN